MGREILVFVVAAGCGFHTPSLGGDAWPEDAMMVPLEAFDGPSPVDVAVDVPAAPTCWDHWLSHDVTLLPPVLVPVLSTTGERERDPWISRDGLRLYFARENGTKGQSDIYRATRTATTLPFGNEQQLDNLNSNVQDSRASLSEDELTLVVASNRAGAFNVFLIRRNAGEELGTPGPGGVENLNKLPGDHYDPFLTADGTRLYFAPDPMGAEKQHLWVSVLDAVDGTFGAPRKLANVNSGDNVAGDSDPAVSRDGRVLVFSSDRATGQGSDDVYYATRASRDDDFGAPLPVPMVNGAMSDADPMLSDDGCTLYWASTSAGTFDLYTAQLVL